MDGKRSCSTISVRGLGVSVRRNSHAIVNEKVVGICELRISGRWMNFRLARELQRSTAAYVISSCSSHIPETKSCTREPIFLLTSAGRKSGGVVIRTPIDLELARGAACTKLLITSHKTIGVLI